MILGIGIDLCRISRMERAIRSRHFLERVFRPEEIAYAEGRGRGRAASLAAAFAAHSEVLKNLPGFAGQGACAGQGRGLGGSVC